MHFSDRLISGIRRAGAPACVGLDPVLEKLPEAVKARHLEPVVAIEEFCRGVIDAVAPIAAAIKPQSACFERYGHRGVESLERLCRHAAGAGLTVILDAKRGDIGVTAEHYAAAAVHAGAHAITVNGYLGPATIEPYLKAGLGVFVLVRTSNPDSDVIQSPALASGGSVAELMAREVAALGARHVGAAGISDVGAVVGATKASDGRTLRARMPGQFFLVPGYGAQGGTADDVRALLNDRADAGGGVIVNASRSVIYAFGPGDAAWPKAISRAALAFVEDLARITG
jgi:orotidine-5'-phosphate decarboxylase